MHQRLGTTSSLRAFAIAAALALALGGCKGAGEGLRKTRITGLSWEGPRPGSNLILVISDTMRRDNIGIYGGTAATPAFDDFASRNLLFERAITHAPWTKPAMATLFTSLYPSQHGVLSHPDTRDAEDGEGILEVDVLPEGVVTLAESLRDAGYRTAAFVANPWLDEQLGFAQGFELYDDSFADFDAPGSRVSEAANRWLESVEPGERYFLYVHYMDCHRPYPTVGREELRLRLQAAPREPRLTDHSTAMITQLVRLDEGVQAANAGFRPSRAMLGLAYDKGVEQFDRAFGTLLRQAEMRSDHDETAIVVTSDHGEAMFTRGYGNHGLGLYNDEIAIPLAARLPGVGNGGDTVRELSGLIDLMPTLCDFLDLTCPEEMFGLSLLEAPSETDNTRLLLAEAVMSKPLNRALFGKRYTLLLQPNLGPDQIGNALFDNENDPDETRNLLGPGDGSAESRSVFDAMLRRAQDELPAYGGASSTFRTIDPEQIERLRALGYLQ